MGGNVLPSHARFSFERQMYPYGKWSFRAKPPNNVAVEPGRRNAAQSPALDDGWLEQLYSRTAACLGSRDKIQLIVTNADCVTQPAEHVIDT